LEKCNTSSDINEHLPTLYSYAKQCETIAEFRVRHVVSSYALAHARPKKLICVDIATNDCVQDFIEVCKECNINLTFHLASTLNYELEEPVDLLFIDTRHTYRQLAQELTLHSPKVKKFLIFHDTETYGYVNEYDIEDEKQGLNPAIEEFLKIHSEWEKLEVFTNNNGLTILKRSE